MFVVLQFNNILSFEMHLLKKWCSICFCVLGARFYLIISFIVLMLTLYGEDVSAAVVLPFSVYLTML